MEHHNESKIKCPYCGYEDEDSWEFDQEEGTTECKNCEKEFNVTRNIEVTYSTSKIACEDNKHNYKTDHYFIKKKEYMGNSKWKELPKHDWKYYKVKICKTCDKKEFVEIA